MTFTAFAQNICGGYPLRTILDNLEENDIEDLVQEYKNFCAIENLGTLNLDISNI